MKKIGYLLCILAIVGFVFLTVADIWEYSINSTRLQEYVDENEENYDDHLDDERDDDDHDEDDCYACEAYDDNMKEYERYSIQYVIETLSSIMFNMVICGILCGAGAITSKVGAKKKTVLKIDASAVQHFAQPADVCSNCGTKRQPGGHFCPYCGEAYEG